MECFESNQELKDKVDNFIENGCDNNLKDLLAALLETGVSKLWMTFLASSRVKIHSMKKSTIGKLPKL